MTTTPIVETERLYARPFVPEDVDLIFELDSDPEVMHFIDKPVTDKAESKKSVRRVMQFYKDHPGYGIFMTVLKDGDIPIGWHCLKDTDNQWIIQVGYRLLPRYWGKGYATEMSKALLDYGFHHHKLDLIIGITHPDHVKSQHVLQKCGLVRNGTRHFYKQDVAYFEISKEDYLKR